MTSADPFQQTVQWLARFAGFPAQRLPLPAELQLCMAALAMAADAAEGDRFLIQRRDGAKDSALRAHALRRSRVHFKCDNSAKV
jgi:hypothetical protein